MTMTARAASPWSVAPYARERGRARGRASRGT